MTAIELLGEVMDGVVLIVGEYRGSAVEMAGYVDKKFGTKIEYVRATHIVECSWHGHIDRVIITERFPEHVTTVEQAAATFTYVPRSEIRVLHRVAQAGTRANLWPFERMGHRRD